MALRDANDVFERAMLPAILLGDVAYQVKMEKRDGFSDTVSVDHLEWGIPKKNLTQEIVSLFKTWGFTPTDTGYEYTIQGVPVKIKVYERNYNFLTNPDLVFYGVDEFKVPNPFEKYWKVRNLIK